MIIARLILSAIWGGLYGGAIVQAFLNHINIAFGLFIIGTFVALLYGLSKLK